MKTCTKCNLALPNDRFYRHSVSNDGLHTSCKTCHGKLVKERYALLSGSQEFKAKKRRQSAASYQKNKAKRLASAKKWRQENPHLQSAYSAKKRAKRLQQIGNAKVTRSDWSNIILAYENKCAACGSSNDLTMDHIVSLKEGGVHAPQNLQPLCRGCNSKKGSKCIAYLNQSEIQLSGEAKNLGNNFWERFLSADFITADENDLTTKHVLGK